MKNKRKLFLPLVLVLIIIGISYVTYYGGIEKRKKVITSGAISMMYVESSNIISINKAIPTIDKTGKVKINKGEYFDFEVAAATKVNMNINYEITVKDVTSSSGKKIDSNHIKLYLTKLDSNNDEKIVMSPQKYKIITSANTKTGRPAGVMSLTKKTMSSSDTVKYRLRMYVDETYNVKKNDDNSSFSVEVNVYGKMKEATSGGKLKAYMTENDWKNNKTPSTDFHTDYYREKITSIITKRNNEVPTTVLEKWDLSEKQDSSIIAYIEDDGTGNNTYKLTIGGKDGIIANESMIYYFNGFSKALSMDLSAFDTLKVTDMSEMFSNCSSLTSLDLSHFDTSNVTNMSSMFSECSSLTSLDLSNFDTSKVTDMSSMFSSCSSLTSLDLSKFDTLQVTDMNGMFFGCSSLTSLDLSNFDTSNVTDMNDMFSGCSSLINLDLLNFDTSEINNMSYMFNSCISLTALDLSNFNTSNVTDMNNMFSNCSSLTILDLSDFNTLKVTDMSEMFSNCSSLISLDLSNFNTKKVTDMNNMFSNCFSLTSLDLSNFNTKKVTDMNNMFSNCYSLSNLDVSNFHTTKVVVMSYMFSSCIKLSNINLSSFNTSKVKTMHGMFFNCKSLKSLNLSNFDTSKVIDMNYMFLKCGNLDNLDFRKATFNKETKHIAIFSKVPSNITIITKNEKTKNWLKDKIKSDNITIA